MKHRDSDHYASLLVVDDEPNIACTIEATLSSPALRVGAAATAQEGIDAVRGLRPSVVLLDIRLPDIGRFTQQRLVAGSTDIYRELAQHVDRVVLDKVLRASRGNQFQAAERLGISRVALRAKLRSLNARPTKEEGGE